VADAVILVLINDVLPFRAGDRCSFSADVAKSLVDRGLAKYVVKPKAQVPAQPQRTEKQEQVYANKQKRRYRRKGR
jgi:hypothetical protein